MSVLDPFSSIRTALLRTVLLAGPVFLLAYAWAEVRGGSGERLATVGLINVVIVVGIQLFVGNSGILSFGHISFAAIGGYTVAVLSTPAIVKGARIPDAPFGVDDVELSPLVGALAALVVVGIVAAVLGLVFLRLAGIAATIVTLAMLVVTSSVLTNWTQLTGGAEAFYGIPRETTLAIAAVVAALAIFVASAFRESSVGLQLQAAREDELAASALGVGVVTARLVAWVVSAIVAGAGGVLLALFLSAITPRDFYLTLTFTTIAMLIVGGERSTTGAVAGVVAVTAGDELFRWLGDGPVVGPIDIPLLPGITNLYLGLVILVAMLLRPDGLFGDVEIDTLVRRALRRGPPPVRLVKGEATEQPARPTSVALQAEGLERTFGGLAAVRDVSLDVPGGAIVGLIGPNGAGKTTVLNLLSGVLPPSRGEILLHGRRLPASPHAVARAGVARTFQTIRLFGDLTVAENVAVGSVVAARHRHVARLDEGELLARFGLDAVADRRARTLAYGDQRRLEIARAAALSPDVVLLDEPAAGMNEVESLALREAIRSLHRLLGCGLLVVDHDLSFILGLCERIYVVDEGAVIAEGTPAEIRDDPDVIAAYLGSGVVVDVGV